MEDLNKLLTQYKEAKDKISALKSQIKDIEDDIKHIPSQVQDIFLKKSISDYGVRGVATFSVKVEENVYFPSKEKLEQRSKLLDFLKKELSEESFLSCLSVNYRFLTNLRESLLDAGTLSGDLPGTVLSLKPKISITKKVKKEL